MCWSPSFETENRMRKSFLLGALVAVVLVLASVACREEPADTEAGGLLESGAAHLEAGEYADAIADLEAAVETDPGSSQAHFLLGQAYNRTDDLLKAREEFLTVLALDPENAAAHHNLGVTYFQLQDLESAVAEFKAALEIDPEDPDTHYQLGAAYLNLALLGADAMASADAGLLAQAVDEFEFALEMEADMPEALIGMGNVYILQGDYPAAIDALQQATERGPDLPQAYYALGQAYAQNGDTTSACEAYSRFLALDPPPNWQAQGEQAMAALGCP